MIAYFINLLIIIIIKLKISFITRSFNFSNLIIKSIVISFYNISGTGVNYIYLYLAWRVNLFY